MASVDSRTTISIDELVNDTIVSGYINPSTNHLMLVSRGGAEQDAGLVAKPFGARWTNTTAYSLGDVVGYAGMLWRAKAATIPAGKPPSLFNSLWERITGISSEEWIERDALFTGDDVTESWELFWKSGNPVVSLTQVAGEFESGLRALKISLAANEYQRLHIKEENIVKGGEKVIITVRAKLLAAASGVTLTTSVIQNNETSTPTPLATGSTTTASAEGSRTLTTSWATYCFTVTTINGKPRATALVSAVCGANPATVLIDYIRTAKIPTTGLAAYPVGAIYKTIDATNPKDILGGGTWVAWGAGRTPVGVDGTTEFPSVEFTNSSATRTHTLTIAEMPTHDHAQAGHTYNWGANTGIYIQNAIAAAGAPPSNNLNTAQGAPGWASTYTQGGGGAHNNLQPYITCYMWKRTA